LLNNFLKKSTVNICFYDDRQEAIMILLKNYSLKSIR
jgi:hypothetical protein